MRYAWLVMCLSGCQCLSPVNEFPPGENPDAGGDAGHVVQLPACNKPNDCTADFKTTDWCFGDGGADWSCVDHRCVPQCQQQGGRTCESEASGCLKCPSTAACATPSCMLTNDTRWRIEQLSCVDTAPLAVGDIIHELPNGTCGSSLQLERDGGSTAFGRLYFQSTNEYLFLGDIDALGGSCIVTGLPTGVERMQYDCPRCQLVIANW